MKRFVLLASLAIFAVAAALPALAASSASSASVVIRHQLRGCHTWSLNGSAYKPDLTVRLARGGSLTITNNDPMVHKLIQQRGPRVGMRTVAHDHMKMVGLHKMTGRGVMNHMGAALRVTFPASGVYRFTTEDLGDYFELEDVGEHNHLMLTVRVT
jgi:hypothetical protein